MYNEIRTPPTVRNHNKSTIKQNVWLYACERNICIFFEINLTSLTLCGRRIKACEEPVTRPSVPHVNKLTHLSKADRQAEAALS